MSVQVEGATALHGRGLLTPLQRIFLSALAELLDQSSFYLTGGTALAEFYLGHRFSFDLDFFTAEDALILPFSTQNGVINIYRHSPFSSRISPASSFAVDLFGRKQRPYLGR